MSLSLPIRRRPPERPGRPGQRSDVLYDVPGPRARLRGHGLTLLFGILFVALGYLVWARFSERGQWDAGLWKPFLESDVWTNLILEGLANTLKAFALASVLALAFGALFGIARLSEHRWVRVPAGAAVEFFRAIPLLILIVFLKFGVSGLGLGIRVDSFTAVVLGLTLYNGSVLAEVVRAGIRSVPRGQAEAAFAIGLRKSGVMTLILLPQAVTAMMPAIVAQLVVLNKDTALGFIVSYEDLLYRGVNVFAVNPPVKYIQTMIVIGAIYVAMNLALGYLAQWLERRGRSSRRRSGEPLSARPAVQPSGADGGITNV